MMNYVITGGAGNISAPLIKNLLAAGKQVTVIGRNAANLKTLTDLGAKAAIGSVEDVAFLTKTFQGADVVYTMIPPKKDAEHWKAHIRKIGENFATAIKGSSIKFVVNLSTIGAHMPEGCGPISGHYFVDQALDRLDGVNILHLRPSYFYQNLFSTIGMVRNAGIIGSNYSIPKGHFPVVAPSEVAEVASEALLSLNFTGQSIRYISSDEISTDDIAHVIGEAIGKTDLQWVVFTDEQALEGMLAAGLSKEVAENYTEMGRAMNSGEWTVDYWKNRPASLGKVKLSDFAKEYAKAYAQ